MELNASDLLVSFTLASDKKVLRRESALIANFERDELKQHVAPTAHPRQNNIPGLFWMSQLNQLIWYSSRLEMFALKQIDFDQKIKAILPKPFELTFKFEGERLRHTPRYQVCSFHQILHSHSTLDVKLSKGTVVTVIYHVSHCPISPRNLDKCHGAMIHASYRRMSMVTSTISSICPLILQDMLGRSVIRRSMPIDQRQLF